MLAAPSMKYVHGCKGSNVVSFLGKMKFYKIDSIHELSKFRLLNLCEMEYQCWVNTSAKSCKVQVSLDIHLEFHVNMTYQLIIKYLFKTLIKRLG